MALVLQQIIIIASLLTLVACDNQVAFRGMSESHHSSLEPNEYPPEDPVFTPPVEPPVEPPVVITPPVEPPVEPPVVITPPVEPPVEPPVVITPPVEPPVEPPVVITPPVEPPVEPPVVITPPVEPPVEPILVENTETFLQAESSSHAVDILVVEDTTISMHEDRWTLHQKFSTAFSHLQGLDWRLGLTSTDVGRHRLDGNLVSFDYSGTKVLTPETRNYKAKFLDKIGFDHCNNDDYVLGWGDVGCSLGSERMLEATIKALSKNAGFLRENANLAVIYLTDNDENVPAGDHLTTPGEVLAAARDKNLLVNGAIIQPGDTTCLAAQRGHFTEPNGAYGTTINSLIRATGGVSTSICGSDFSSLFSNITGKLGETPLADEFALEHTNVQGVVVTLIPEQDLEYEVVGNKIKFSSAPVAGTEIKVTYKYEK